MRNTLAYRKTGVVHALGTETADQLLSRIVDRTVILADLVSILGAIIGHVETFIYCPAGEAIVDVKHVDKPEVWKCTTWEGGRYIDACEVTIDLFTYVMLDAPIEEEVRGLFALPEVKGDRRAAS